MEEQQDARKQRSAAKAAAHQALLQRNKHARAAKWAEQEWYADADTKWEHWKAGAQWEGASGSASSSGAWPAGQERTPAVPIALPVCMPAESGPANDSWDEPESNWAELASRPLPPLPALAKLIFPQLHNDIYMQQLHNDIYMQQGGFLVPTLLPAPTQFQLPKTLPMAFSNNNLWKGVDLPYKAPPPTPPKASSKRAHGGSLFHNTSYQMNIKTCLA